MAVLYTIVIAFLVNAVQCDDTGVKRLIFDETINVTEELLRLSTEIISLKQVQSQLITDVSNLSDTLTMVSRELAETTAKLQHASTSSKTSSGIGSVYVRWGKSSCVGSDAELVYSGYAGGSIWTSKGAASNYICLVPDPMLISNKTGDKGAQVFGAEYIFDNAQWVSASNDLFGKDITYQDVPCAVCRSPRPSTIMVPGKSTCNSGWYEEYSGYLSAGYYGHDSSSEFVCLDRFGEARANTSAHQFGKLFYLVRARCGSLPCPPYEEGKDLTCVVCSK